MSSMQSRKLDGIVIVENLINKNELKHVNKLISNIPCSMNSFDLLKNGHKEFYEELQVNAVAIGSFLQNHYKVDLNFTSVRPPFFRKTPLNHETEIHAELYFPTQKIRVPPKGGSFIAFPGDTRYAHGVLPIVEGIRYSAPMWFSIID
ncbi:MAG: 2OG-Fe(II) oxygenase [Flavobacteriaceae bacterium]|nr:2OG-Fe(II) oxygenase [Flavobacteriaceae bacterium]